LFNGVEMEKKTATTGQARRFLLLLCLILLLFTSISLYSDLSGIHGRYGDLAAEVGRSFYQAIDAMRKWNLDHGGIYMRVSPDTPPNPYLENSLREVTTNAGVHLAMINHAQMTRLMSELLTNQRGIHVHITGLLPIRPGNNPDEWERSVLTRFEKGSAEEFDVVGAGNESVFRYMAPLAAGGSCNSCHDQSHRRFGKVSGGISVAFSYGPFLKMISREQRQNVLVHVFFFVLGLALIGLTGGKLIKSIAALQDSLLRIKRLEGFLPICAKCKNIRLEGTDYRRQESWVAIERYIQERTDAEFTHGLCPQCASELYPELARRREG